MRYGGPIYSVHGLCRALARRGHEVHVFTTNVDGPGVSDVPIDRTVDLDEVSVRYFPTAFGRRLYRSPAMGRALARTCGSFDVVHLHSVFLWPTMAAARVARRSGTPYVVTPRGMLVSDLIARKSRWAKRAWIGLVERRSIEQAAAVHVTSRLEAEEMQAMGFAPRRTVVIPNALDMAGVPATPSADDEAWIGTLPQRFALYLGRINWKKGLDRLIAALARTKNIDLVVAGHDDEKYEGTLQSLARELGVANKIIFTGPVFGSRKWALLRRARMLVLASHSENFGMVVLEAMAVGCPVVVTAGVGLAETVRACGAGLVVEGDAAPLAAAITSLEGNEAARRQMGSAGRKAAAEQFSWTRVADEMAELYARCLNPAKYPSKRVMENWRSAS